MKPVVTRPRPFPAGWIVCALIVVAVTASAQESLDAKQVVGKWEGTLHAAGRTPVSAEVEFKPDGAFEGGSNVGHSDEVSYTGRWTVDGETILVEFTAEGSGAKSDVSWTLSPDGDKLSGGAVRQLGMLRYDVSLRQAE